jgi:ribonuclease HI
MILLAYTDGASRGNPGHSGIGFVITDAAGTPVASNAAYIGTSTNNIAEYSALIKCLETIAALPEQPHALKVYSDSELMVRQINGVYKVKDEKLKQLHKAVRALLASAPYNFSITHVPRAMNRQADSLANEAIDAGLSSGLLP